MKGQIKTALILLLLLTALLLTVLFLFRAQKNPESSRPSPPSGASKLDVSGAQKLSLPSDQDEVPVEQAQSDKIPGELAKLLEKVPESMRGRAQFQQKRQRDAVLYVQMLVDGIEVNGADLVLRRNNAGELEEISGALPDLQDFSEAAFPAVDVDEYKQKLVQELDTKENSGLRIYGEKKIWGQGFASSEWVPKLQLHADWVDDRSRPHKEVWEYNANTGELIKKHSRVRDWKTKSDGRAAERSSQQ